MAAMSDIPLWCLIFMSYILFKFLCASAYVPHASFSSNLSDRWRSLRSLLPTLHWPQRRNSDSWGNVLKYPVFPPIYDSRSFCLEIISNLFVSHWYLTIALPICITGSQQHPEVTNNSKSGFAPFHRRRIRADHSAAAPFSHSPSYLVFSNWRLQILFSDRWVLTNYPFHCIKLSGGYGVFLLQSNLIFTSVVWRRDLKFAYNFLSYMILRCPFASYE